MLQSNLHLCLVLLTSLTDVTLTLAILSNGGNWRYLASSILNYSYSTSCVDFILLSVLRTVFIFGGALGLVFRKWKKSNNLFRSSFSISIGAICFYYMSVKVLVSSGYNSFKFISTTWFWILHGWNCLASILFIILWYSLGVIQLKLQSQDSPSITVVNDVGEDVAKRSLLQEKDHSSREDTLDPNKKTRLSKSTSTFSKFLQYVKDDKYLILLAFVFLVGTSMAETYMPLLAGRAVSSIVVPDSSHSFMHNVVMMALISVVASVCAGFRGGIFSLVDYRVAVRVRKALYSSIVHQEIGFFDKTKTGEIISRLTSDTATMSDTIGLNCNVFLRSTLKTLIISGFMISLSWRLTIAIFMGIPIVTAISKGFGFYFKKLRKSIQDRLALTNEVADEVISSMQTIRSFANEPGEIERYSDRLHGVYSLLFKQASAWCVYRSLTSASGFMLLVAVLWYGCHLVEMGIIQSDVIIAFVLYQFSLADCISYIGAMYTGIMQALGSAEKVIEIIERQPEISLDEGYIETVDITGSIVFDNVTFSYPGRPDQYVLQNVSFAVKPGETVALVGPSGGGKSSCIKLLQRFYKPSSGNILLDGNPISFYTHKYYHEKVALVGQEPTLFARSILDNILYGLDKMISPQADNSSEYDAIEAAKMANAHCFVEELKQQYQTETGEKGAQLSGGQKQRIAIARSLVRKPKVLLLDEATSALDAHSEYLVQEALDRGKEDRTVLLVAHRLSTVEKADRIIVLEKGQVVEQGCHSKLMQQKGTYYDLVHRQLHRLDDASTYQQQ